MAGCSQLIALFGFYTASARCTSGLRKLRRKSSAPKAARRKLAFFADGLKAIPFKLQGMEVPCDEFSPFCLLFL